MSRLIPKDRIKRVLFIRNDAIGDAALTLAPIRTLKETYPDVHITVLAAAYNARIMRHLDYIDEVIIDREATDLASFLSYTKWIKSFNFDVAIHCRAKGKTSWACFFAGVPYNVGDKAHISLYPVYRKYGIFFRSFDVTSHIIEFHYALLRPFGITVPDPLPNTLYTPKEDLEKATSFLAAHKRRADKPLISIQVGTGGGNRPITPEKYAAYINGLLAKQDVDVCITGYNDRELVAMDAIQALVSTPIIRHERIPIVELMGLFELSDVVVSVDTGPFHLATGVGTPLVAIFPSKKVKPSRWGPWGNRHFVVRENRNCLHDCPHQRCPYSICSDDIAVEDMIQKTMLLLDGKGKRDALEQRKYWIKTGLNVAILYDDASEEEAMAFKARLESWGYYALTHSIHSPTLFQFLREHDTLLVHNLSKKKSLSLWMITQKLTAHLHYPPLILTKSYDTEDDLVHAYREGNQKRLV